MRFCFPKLCTRSTIHSIHYRINTDFKQYLFIFSVALNLILVCAYIFHPEINISLNNHRIVHKNKYLYSYPIGTLVRFPYQLSSDDLGGNGKQSTLVLFEDGKTLGPAHSLHENIRSKGQGRFSHWGNHIYFSSSDNSSPLENNRIYSIRAKPWIRPIVWLPCLWILFFSILLQDNSSLTRLILGTTSTLPKSKASLFTLTIIGILLSMGLIAKKWYTGNTSSLGIAGFLPVSDALGYWKCSNLVETSGKQFPYPSGNQIIDWCSRRILYPSFLSGLLRITDWSLSTAILIQGGLIATCMIALFLAAIPYMGIVSSALMLWILFDFANCYAFGFTMTENIGLGASTAALALLLTSLSTGRSVWLWFGLVMFSVAMFARPGAMFVLPLFFAWSVLLLRNRGYSLVTSIFFSGATLCSGLLLQKLFIIILGMNSGAAYGNFATTLYRLSTGAANWSAAYNDYPDLFQSGSIAESEAFQKLYVIAFLNILNQPYILISSYLRDASTFIPPFLGYDQSNRLSPILIVLISIGFADCLRNWRQPLPTLLIAGFIGEILTVPLLYADGNVLDGGGGGRIFSATIGIRAIITGIGFSTIIRYSRKAAGRLNRNTFEYYQIPVYSPCDLALPGLLAGVATSILSALLVLPYSGLLGFSALRPTVSAVPPCAELTRSAIMRLNHESSTLSVTDSQSNLMPLHIPHDRLRGNLPSCWYCDGFRTLPPNTTVIQGINLSDLGYPFQEWLNLIWYGPLPPYNATVSVCIDPEHGTTLGDFPYYEVKRMYILNKDGTFTPVSTLSTQQMNTAAHSTNNFIYYAISDYI